MKGIPLVSLFCGLLQEQCQGIGESIKQIRESPLLELCFGISVFAKKAVLKRKREHLEE